MAALGVNEPKGRAVTPLFPPLTSPFASYIITLRRQEKSVAFLSYCPLGIGAFRRFTHFPISWKGIPATPGMGKSPDDSGLLPD